jgi:diguanylate cyclase (GGDEF)-like protein/PAS domain S-box-containing protein
LASTLVSQQDYALFLHGLALLVLHGVCMILTRAHGDRLGSWRWLSRFGLLLGIGQWAASLAVRPLPHPVGTAVTGVLTTASAVMLAAFIRTTMLAPGRMPTVHKAVLTTGGLVSLAAATSCVVASDALVSILQAVACLSSLAMAALVFGLHRRSAKSGSRRILGAAVRSMDIAVAVALTTVVVGGWFFVNAAGRRADRWQRSCLLQKVASSAACIEPSLIARLSDSPSVSATNHREVLGRLRAILRANAECRFVYLVGLRGDQVVILADAEPESSPDYVRPGELYTDAPTPLAQALARQREMVIGPYSDRWGMWVSAFAPVGARASGGMPVMLGFDLPALNWARDVAQHRTTAIAIIMLASLFVLLTAAASTATRASAEKAIESERRFRCLAEGSPNVIAFFDAEGKFTDINPAGLKRMGGHREDVIGRPFVEVWAESQQAIADNAVRLVLCGERCSFEAERIDGTGRTSVWYVVLNPLTMSEGRVTGFASIWTEITEIRQAEQDLQQQKEFFQLLLDTIPNPLFYKNSDGVYLGCNRAFTDLTGLTCEHVVGKTVFDIAPPDMARVYKDADDELLRAGGRQSYESTVKYADGNTHHVIFHKAVFSNPQGEPAGIVGTAVDITDRKRLEERLRKLNECMLSLGADTDENINRLTALCGELLGASCALYNRLRDGMLCSEGCWNTPGDFNPVDKPDGHICFDVIRQAPRDVVVLRNLQESDYVVSDPAVARYGLQTYVGKLVRLGDEAVGSLCAVFGDDWEPSEEDKQVIEIAALAIETEESRRSAGEALRQERDKLEAVTNNLGARITLVSPDHRILWTNNVMRNRFGDIEGQKCHMVYHGSASVCEDCGAEKMFETGVEQVIQERKAVGPDGEESWFQVVVTPVRDARGEITAALKMLFPITERKRMEEALRENEVRYRTLFESSAEGIFVLSDVFIDCNEQACRLCGCSREQIIGRTPADFSPPLQPDGRRSDDAANSYMNAALAGKPQLFRWKHMKADGTLIDTEVGLNPVTLNGQRVLQATMRDISERTAAEEAMRSQVSAMNAASDQILIANSNGEVVFANSAFIEEMGCSESEVIGKQMHEWMGIDHRQELDFDEIWNTAVENGTWHGEILRRLDDGSDRYEDTTLTAVRDSSGEVESVIAIKRNVTDKKLCEERLDHLAHHDPLTGLPNRLLFSDRLNHSLAQAKRHDTKVAVMFLDLDRFKLINDTMGHKAGDALLWQVAGRLTNRLRGVDTIARMGGDEFTIVLTDIQSPEDAAAVAERVLSLFAEPFTLTGHELFVSTSVGISIYPHDGTDVETLVRNADTAMYRAKEQGKNSFCMYTESLNAAAMEQMTLLNNLRKALQNGEFSLHYQPRVDIQSGGIVGVEALIRWHHPQLGWIPPGQFIPLAEESGLIVMISEWVLKTACRQNKAWQESGLPEMDVAVNISARELEDDAFVRLVKRTLEETGLRPGCLGLEVTEGTLMRNPELSAEILHELKAMGVKISIDDFGTGHSSLSKLKRLPIHTVKIDQSFIKDIATNSDDASIAEAVVAMAHSLKLNVLAEGVETIEQLDLLRSLGCDEVQGYFIGKPLPADELAELLSEAQHHHRRVSREAA